ncbi:hypothetical protein BH18ACT15_BH18ACT15_02890 [soil metagenome]
MPGATGLDYRHALPGMSILPGTSNWQNWWSWPSRATGITGPCWASVSGLTGEARSKTGVAGRHELTRRVSVRAPRGPWRRRADVAPTCEPMVSGPFDWEVEMNRGNSRKHALRSTATAMGAMLLLAAMLVVVAAPALAGPHHVRHVIKQVWGPDWREAQALSVASCESGFRTHAKNGQYLGVFQMGLSERHTFNPNHPYSRSALRQARGAHRYFIASGRDWSPWSCR